MNARRLVAVAVFFATLSLGAFADSAAADAFRFTTTEALALLGGCVLVWNSWTTKSTIDKAAGKMEKAVADNTEKLKKHSGVHDLLKRDIIDLQKWQDLAEYRIETLDKAIPDIKTLVKEIRDAVS